MQKSAVAGLGLLLVAAALAWWKTAPPSTQVFEKRSAAPTTAGLVDERTYATAQRLALLASSAQERPLAESVLRIADHELALAFSAALHDIEAHPPHLTAAAAKIQDRLQKSQALLTADQQQVERLTALLKEAKAPQKDTLQDQLQLAQSQLDLDQDEVEEAGQDLIAAGGNPKQHVEALLQEHEAQMKARSAMPSLPSTAALPLQHGSLSKLRRWLELRRKLKELGLAHDSADVHAASMIEQRTELASGLDHSKGGIAELAQHTRSAKEAAMSSADGSANGQPSRSHEDTAAVLDQTKLIAASQKVLTLLDRQTADQRQLAVVYLHWMAVVSLQTAAALHSLMRDAMIVVGIVLLVLLADHWILRLLDRPKLDRRQIETLRSLARMGLRVLAVVIILLIVIGMPNQFGTMLGIVGAGLTVAMKDFIVAFFGWLVLMGRNGIRLGDWVEVNGVSGEVTELGMFHTVLLETGNWSDAGHPTGRRVTFTNSFAIEGHYFNFSTSGQWLWDELQVVVPAGQDPYRIVDEITRQVAEATADGARQAEQEWQRAVPALRGKTFSSAPGVNLKPVVGGVEISVRYITRANERFMLRAKLYQGAVDLLGQRAATIPRSERPASA